MPSLLLPAGLQVLPLPLALALPSLHPSISALALALALAPLGIASLDLGAEKQHDLLIAPFQDASLLPGLLATAAAAAAVRDPSS